MDDKDIMFLRNVLLLRRKDVLDRVNLFVAAWKDIERAIELEEEAQKASITEPYDRLDESRKNEVEQIDLALSKMAVGDYGICESCGDDISTKRLEALPWARLCVDCARDFERRRESLPRTSEILANAQIPEQYRALSSERIVRLIHDQMRKHGEAAVDSIRIFLRRGFVYLEGSVPTESEHRAMLQILTDVMGFFSIVDKLEIDEALAPKTERALNAEESEESEADDEESAESLYEDPEEAGFYDTSEEPAQYEDNL